jgi:hypothetical protein
MMQKSWVVIPEISKVPRGKSGAPDFLLPFDLLTSGPNGESAFQLKEYATGFSIVVGGRIRNLPRESTIPQY